MDVQRLFFSLNGRLNRKPYFFGNLALGVISAIFKAIQDNSDGALISILTFVVAICVVVGSISLIVKRLHDLDKNGLFVLISLIPLVNALFGLYLLLAKGTDGPNRFGEDPLQAY